VALANKLARITSAALTKEDTYRPPLLAVDGGNVRHPSWCAIDAWQSPQAWKSLRDSYNHTPATTKPALDYWEKWIERHLPGCWRTRIVTFIFRLQPSGGPYINNRWNEKTGLQRDVLSSQIIDALEAHEMKETGDEEA
jgi:hypothetical protein